MKRWILLAVFAVVLSTAATVAVQYMPASTGPRDETPFPVGPKADKGPKPKAVLEEKTTFDFGTMAQQATGKHAWVVKNTGEADLELTMISSTCSCTLAKFKDGKSAVVKPGESTDIVLEFETRTNNGDYRKGANIGTNDPSLPQFSLHVHGNVYPAVMTMPPGGVVNFQGISNDDEDHVMHVAVYSKDRPETKIVKITTSKPDDILVTYTPLAELELKELQVDKGYHVSIDIKPTLPLGNFKEEVRVIVDHPQQSEVRLAVVGKMSGPISYTPTSGLEMHQVEGKTGGRGEVTLTVRNKRPVAFTVASAPKDLVVQVLPFDDSAKPGRYRLAVTIPPGTSAKKIEGDIVLKSDHPKASELSVPVSVWVLNR